MFQVLYHPSVVGEDLSGLNRDIKDRLKAAIGKRLTNAPQDYGKPLRGQLQSLWSLRVGDYRVIYRIDAEQVKIFQMVHRRDAYQAGILEARRRGWL